MIDRYPAATIPDGQELAWRRDSRIDALRHMYVQLEHVESRGHLDQVSDTRQVREVTR
jgi:hypothetical protein